MGPIETFFLTAVEEQGRWFNFFGCSRGLEEIGNILLTPARVLWGGKTVRIVRMPLSNTLLSIHSVTAFHEMGAKLRSRTVDSLHASELNWVRTTLAVILLIPGVILGAIFKGLAFFTEETNENYRYIRQHFTPIDIAIGSRDMPISERTEDLHFTAARMVHAPLNQKARCLTLFGDGRVVLTARGDDLKRYDPEKVILNGVRLLREERPSFWQHPVRAIRDHLERGVDAVRDVATGSFLEAVAQMGGFEMDGGMPVVHVVHSIEEAKAHKTALRTIYRVVPPAITLNVGDPENPVTEKNEDLKFQVVQRALRDHCGPVGALVIHGDGAVSITARGDFVREADPKKIILSGATLDPLPQQHFLGRARDAGRELLTGRFEQVLVESGDYEVVDGRVKVYEVASIEEALEHQPPLRENGIAYQAVYRIREGGR